MERVVYMCDPPRDNTALHIVSNSHAWRWQHCITALHIVSTDATATHSWQGTAMPGAGNTAL